MKIGLVLDDTLDTPDGVQQYVITVGAWLTAQGHDVHYLVGNTVRTDIANVHSLSRNLHVRFNGNRMSMPLPASRRKLRSFLSEQQFDVLHVQVPYSPFLAGRLLKMVPRTTAVIGTFHILPYTHTVTLANRLLALLNHRSGKRFDQVLAVSGPAAEFALRIYGYQATILPNPIKLADFQAAISTSSTTTIVTMGRLVVRKGAQYLLSALAYMRDAHLYEGDYRVIIGSKGELLGELERMVRELQLSGNVSFYGFVAEADKPEFLAQADIAVYPSIGGESFGIVLLEGMAAARGVVLAGNNPGYASVMQPFPEQLVDPQDIPAFAERLAHYLSQPDARSHAATAQHAYVKHFDVGVVGAELMNVYDKALQSRRES